MANGSEQPRVSHNSCLGQPIFDAEVQPSLQHIVEIGQEESADEDDSGDPENPEKNLHRQLRRIRRGEVVGDLILRM